MNYAAGSDYTPCATFQSIPSPLLREVVFYLKQCSIAPLDLLRCIPFSDHLFPLFTILYLVSFSGGQVKPLWLNPAEAEKRGIKNGDIIKISNERGAVLGGAYITERLRPGVAYIDHGARCDWIIPGELDRGGAINLISPEGTVSKNAPGQATSGFLVQVEKVSLAQMEEWRKLYPEAFEKEYHPASGLRFNA